MSPRDQLATVFTPDLLGTLEAYVDERIARALEAQPTNGHARWVTLEDGADLAGCSVDAIRMRIKRRPDNYRTRHEGSRVYVLRADVDPEPDDRRAVHPTHPR